MSIFAKTIFSILVFTQIFSFPCNGSQAIWYQLTDAERDKAPIEFKAKVVDMTVDEFKFLSSVVEAESDRNKTDESIENRTMIAVVILNRVESKKFPNTITKVLKQKGQFSVVSSGAYKRVGRTKLSDKAVIEAVRRKNEGIAPAVLYFRSGHYFKNHKRYAKIGDNYFSY